MKDLFFPSSIYAFILLLATCISVGLFDFSSFGAPDAHKIAAMVILAIALVKVRLIMYGFMGVGRMPVPWRIALNLWLVVAGCVIGYYYLAAGGA